MSSHQTIAAIKDAQAYMGQVIQIQKAVLDDEVDFDPGMLGVIVQIKVDPKDEMFGFLIDTRPFTAYNDPLMIPNYFGKQGEPTLTAREAGQWSDIQCYYIAPKPLIATRFITMGIAHNAPFYTWEKNRDIVVSFFENETAFNQYKLAPMPTYMVDNARDIAKTL